MTQIETRCAWCGVHMAGDVGAIVMSHGICGVCSEREFPEVGSFRERQIQAVAGLIANNVRTLAFWRTMNDAADQNRLGWTVDVSDGTETGWLRCEGVVLTPDELDRAIKASWETA